MLRKIILGLLLSTLSSQAFSAPTACNIFFAPSVAERLESKDLFCAGDKSLVPADYDDFVVLEYPDTGKITAYIKGQYSYLAYDKTILERQAKALSKGNEFIALGLLAVPGGIEAMYAVGVFITGYYATKFLDKYAVPQ